MLLMYSELNFINYINITKTNISFICFAGWCDGYAMMLEDEGMTTPAQ